MQLPKDKKYTYADYLTWDDGHRYELIDGVPYMMAPAPTPLHQEISASLVAQLWAYLKGKRCKVYAAPFDVRLSADAEDDTVVQPDLSIVCDPSKIDERGCKGAPDMVVEILSPSTMRQDQITKLNKYRDAGIREYWIVNPETRSVQVCLLEDSKYTIQGFTDADTIPVHVLDDCSIDLGTVFPQVEEASSANADTPPWE